MQETLRKLLSAQIARYGEITKLTIDANRETIGIVLQLEGDEKPINITLGGYSLVASGAQTLFVATKFNCDRIWLRKWLVDHPNYLAQPIPPELLPIVATLLTKDKQ